MTKLTFPEYLILLGAVMVGGGVAAIYWPVGVIVGGILLMAFSGIALRTPEQPDTTEDDNQ